MTFFLIGSAKSLWSTQTAFWSGFEVFAIGSAAAAAAYGVGALADALV